MLKLYNTSSKKIEEFKPINSDLVTIYVCGPTVYSDIHIGNARPVIFFDTLKNYLEYLNFNVKYVSNITDVDDKIIDEAIKLNIKESLLTEKYTEAFKLASTSVGSKLPDEMPRATAFIDEMIVYIENLIENDYAYATNSGVYFKTSKVDGYGSISGQKLDELEESVRIDNNSDKEDFKDFTLWKTTNVGMSYDSPWGKGRPGWHTECAVMNHEIFNGMIDIHGGGSDLIFPHHENENAQTIAHDGHGLAKYWMHVGRVDFLNDKMSKSLGNTILVKDLDDPISYRLLVLAHHYRNPINFNEDLRVEFIHMYDKIVRSIKRTILKVDSLIEKSEPIKDYLDKFMNEMNNDFNTPNVITLILDLVKELNREKDDLLLARYYQTLIIILDILAINPQITLNNDIIKLYQNWEDARNLKDYSKADLYRKELVEKGWI